MTPQSIQFVFKQNGRRVLIRISIMLNYFNCTAMLHFCCTVVNNESNLAPYVNVSHVFVYEQILKFEVSLDLSWNFSTVFYPSKI